MQNTRMFMIYHHAKFQMQRFSGSLVIAIEQRAEENILTDDMLLFYILQKYYLNKSFIFFKINRLNMTDVAPVLQFRAPAILLFLTVQNYKMSLGFSFKKER